MRRLAPAVLAATLGAMAWATIAPAEGGGGVYLHNRKDYQAFRDARPGEVLEPNYLPFMAARVELPQETSPWRVARRWLRGLVGIGEPADELLIFCRWPDEAFPLRVRIAPPHLDVSAVDALFPRPPREYVAAVERALVRWEKGLEGRVRFELVSSREAADLTIELLGEEAPVPDPAVQVLGATPLGDACQVEPDGAEGGRLRVRYRVPELRVFVADQHGLLLPDQVQHVALHEIGHALGMHGHSPIPNDLMFRVVRDRLPRGELGVEDVNSFVSLYTIPNGTVYRALTATTGGERAEPRPPAGPPRLALAPHVDARLGYEVQLPEGWTRLAMEQGVVAVDGVTWDYTCSFQLLVRAYPSLGAYLDRHAAAHLGEGTLLEEREVEVAGRRGLRFVLASGGGGAPGGGFVEELTFVEAGDGRVVVAIAESPDTLHEAYRPFFEAILASLELHEHGPGASDRDYSTGSGGDGGIGPR